MSYQSLAYKPSSQSSESEDWQLVPAQVTRKIKSKATNQYCAWTFQSYIETNLLSVEGVPVDEIMKRQYSFWSTSDLESAKPSLCAVLPGLWLKCAAWPVVSSHNSGFGCKKFSVIIHYYFYIITTGSITTSSLQSLLQNYYNYYFFLTAWLITTSLLVIATVITSLLLLPLLHRQNIWPHNYHY